MATWPAGLPQKPFAGLKETPQAGFIRSPMDTGQPKSRGRFTATIRATDIPMVLTKTERETFDTFYDTTINKGANSFDWDMDPVDEGTSSTISYRFTKPPAWSKIANEWRTVLKLEILP